MKIKDVTGEKDRVTENIFLKVIRREKNLKILEENPTLKIETQCDGIKYDYYKYVSCV